MPQTLTTPRGYHCTGQPSGPIVGLRRRPLSASVFAAWHGPQMACRLAAASVPPCDFGTTWSTSVASVTRPFRLSPCTVGIGHRRGACRARAAYARRCGRCGAMSSCWAFDLAIDSQGGIIPCVRNHAVRASRAGRDSTPPPSSQIRPADARRCGWLTRRLLHAAIGDCVGSESPASSPLRRTRRGGGVWGRGQDGLWRRRQHQLVRLQRALVGRRCRWRRRGPGSAPVASSVPCSIPVRESRHRSNLDLAQPEGAAPLQDGLHGLKPPIRTGYAPCCRRQASARVAQPGAFQAKPPVVAVTVAQRHPFRQVVGVGVAQQREAFRARREGRYLGVIPAGGMTPSRFVVCQPVGPISGRPGRLAGVGRACCAVSFRRPHDAEAFSHRQKPSGHRLAAGAAPQQVQTADAGVEARARGLARRVFTLDGLSLMAIGLNGDGPYIGGSLQAFSKPGKKRVHTSVHIPSDLAIGALSSARLSLRMGTEQTGE